MVGRNEPCPCGSGKRYKDCHGSLAAPPEKVAFVIAGTQKGGTTALASYLYEHPEIGMPTVKEVHFFDTEEHFASAEVDYAKYHAYFNPARAQAAARRRDADLYVLGARAAAHPALQPGDEADHAAAQSDDARLFALEHGTRAAARSAAVRAGDPHRGGARAATRCLCSIDSTHTSTAASTASRLRRIWRHFPVGQTLVLKSEELQRTPDAALARITDFLGVARFPPVEPRTVHARPYQAGDATPIYMYWEPAPQRILRYNPR